MRLVNNKIMVTGASGFLGRHLIRSLSSLEHGSPIACVRQVTAEPVLQNAVCVGDINASTQWSHALLGVQTVIHVAAIAHLAGTNSPDVQALYRQVNVEGTLNLAAQAAAAGVRRFVFISSIGVNGQVSTRPFQATDEVNPLEPYALSKWQAEQGLWEIQHNTGIEVVVIRPPLVYGRDAPGNFANLVRWVEKGLPLPLGAVHNKRTLVGIDNLVSLITTCITHPAAANQTFLAGDAEDLSTSELLRKVAVASGAPSRLVPVPTVMLRLAALLLGRKLMAQRLLGSLQADIGRTCELLSWKPPHSVDEGLKRCFTPADQSVLEESK